MSALLSLILLDLEKVMSEPSRLVESKSSWHISSSKGKFTICFSMVLATHLEENNFWKYFPQYLFVLKQKPALKNVLQYVYSEAWRWESVRILDTCKIQGKFMAQHYLTRLWEPEGLFWGGFPRPSSREPSPWDWTCVSLTSPAPAGRFSVCLFFVFPTSTTWETQAAYIS